MSIPQIQLSLTPTALMEWLYLFVTPTGMLLIWRRCGWERCCQCDGSMSSLQGWEMHTEYLLIHCIWFCLLIHQQIKGRLPCKSPSHATFKAVLLVVYICTCDTIISTWICMKYDGIYTDAQWTLDIHVIIHSNHMWVKVGWKCK